ncbi:hypothetical protein GCM10010394_12730 [Streptomyces crystallinus]|uniref:Uncharacterized protein n=1 Tax=Streptomyces crystallinus TaxID=68191 RepID=A0ABP3Q823_9ACTN
MRLAGNHPHPVRPAGRDGLLGAVGALLLGQAHREPAGGLGQEQPGPARLLDDRLAQPCHRVRAVAAHPLEVAAQQRPLPVRRPVPGRPAVQGPGTCGPARVGGGPQPREGTQRGGEFGEVRGEGAVRERVLGQRRGVRGTPGEGERGGERQTGRGDPRPVRGLVQDPLGEPRRGPRTAAEEQDQGVHAVQRCLGAGRRGPGAQGDEFVGGARRVAIRPAAVGGEGRGQPQPAAGRGRRLARALQHLAGLRGVPELDQRAGQRDGGGARALQGPAGEAAGQLGVLAAHRFRGPDQQRRVDRAVRVELPARAGHRVRAAGGAGVEQGGGEPPSSQPWQPVAQRRAQHRLAEPDQDLPAGLGRAEQALLLQALHDVRGDRLQDRQRERLPQGDRRQGVLVARVETAQPALEQLRQPGRHGERAAPPPQAARAHQPPGVAAVADQFGQEQRVSAGPLVEQVHRGVGGGAVHQRVHQPGGIGAAERGDVQALQIAVLPERHHGVGGGQP